MNTLLQSNTNLKPKYNLHALWIYFICRHYDTSDHAGIPKFTFVALFAAFSAPYRHVFKADIFGKRKEFIENLFRNFLLQKKHA